MRNKWLKKGNKREQSLASRFCRMLPSDLRSFGFYILVDRKEWSRGGDGGLKTVCRMVKMRTFLLTLHLLADRSKVEWLVNNLELPDSDALERLSFEPKALLVLRRYRPSAFNTAAQDNVHVVHAAIIMLRNVFTPSQIHSHKFWNYYFFKRQLHQIQRKKLFRSKHWFK